MTSEDSNEVEKNQSVLPEKWPMDAREARRDSAEVPADARLDAESADVVRESAGSDGRGRISFIVPGTPVGKGRPKFARRGAFVSAYTPEKTANYENLVKVVAAQAMAGRQIIEGNVSVSLAIQVQVPDSWSKKKRAEALSGAIAPTSKPDLDNIIKGIFDAMNGVVFKDDKQVSFVTALKIYSQTPCVHVCVYQKAKRAEL